MSIFRETFPAFIQDELARRQDGMITRNPAFLHQLNSRSAWVRMTSGVDFEGSSTLAKNYVLQGGVLNYSLQGKKDNFTQKNGLGDGSNAYSNKSQGGAINRTGIKPMPGITNVAIQSKGAYGSLQEATVTFNCWDIKQLEELELLYMRPGYTVLLEFGWDFARVNGALPSYDILNQSDITLNDAFAQIYELIDQSGGTYDALLGYVKNYNWSARDDGGYDCTTSIISLGEVLESLKCNWVPGETIAFDNSGKGILQIPNNIGDKVVESYEKGIIPGLIQELWNYGSRRPNKTSGVITDPRTGNYYYLYRQDVRENKNDRGGLVKNLGQGDKTEVYITLGSFCDLLSTYVFPKGAKNQPLSELVTYETDYKSKSYIKYSAKNTTNSKESLFASMPTSNAFATSLKCIASPLAISTNLGICYVRNDNWNNLTVQAPSTSTTATPVVVKADIKTALEAGTFASTKSGYENAYPNNIYKRFAGKIKPLLDSNNDTYYVYGGNLETDLDTLAKDLIDSIKDIKIEQKTTNINNVDTGTSSTSNVLQYTYIFENGKTFTYNPTSTSNNDTIDLLSIFGPTNSDVYDDLFLYEYNTNGEITKNTSLLGFLKNDDPFDTDFLVREFQNPTKQWDKQGVLNLIQKKLSKVSLDNRLKQILTTQTPAVANQVAAAAATISSKDTLPFLEDNNGSSKQLGYISNIYVNLNYLYEQAISKNHASNDTQNKNTISIRDYIQGIMRDVQNSLGNINNFDIQVDNRNAIGRIIDINFTGATTTQLFQLEIHNLNSVVRDYKFSSKIFPEMGSIIAISAQDATGIGKLGYDNATLVAWNEGISDRLIPKKDFNSSIALNDPNKPNSPATFLLPFLTKIYNYFQYINNKSVIDDFNYAYGGLDFAYKDFLSNLDRFDPQNRFKTIIPTELSITLDGLGGIIIGNLFKINQDIVPKGYKNTGGRNVAYIVTRLGHQISGNDWTTELSAYPVVFENAKSAAVWKKWDNNQYPGTISINIGNRRVIIGVNTSAFDQTNLKTAINFFQSKGYQDYQIAALVGGFLQESQLNPGITNSIGAIGIAQWLGARKTNLKAKSNYNTLETQLNFVQSELISSEKAAGTKLKNSTDLESAIAAAAAYERFGGITKGAATTYDDVLNAIEVGARVEFAQDLLTRIKAGDFK